MSTFIDRNCLDDMYIAIYKIESQCNREPIVMMFVINIAVYFDHCTCTAIK